MFEVVALAVEGKQKIFKVGELVTTEDFEEGAVPELIRDGFLKEKEQKKKGK